MIIMIKFNILCRTGGRFNQVIAVVAATINAISDGMQYAWTSPALPILLSDETTIEITKSDVVWLENIFMIGGLFGIPITIYAVDSFGRKKSILIATTQSTIAWLMIAFTPSVNILYVARFLSGVAANVAFVSIPMYIAELADHTIRGFLGSFDYIMMLFGILIVYCVVPYVSIMASSLLAVTFLVLQFITLPFMPESPYFLIMKGRDESAKKSLKILRSPADVEAEFENISNAVKRQLSERGRIIDLLLIDSNRKATVIMFMLNMCQQLSGITVILMNLHHIMEDAAPIITKNVVAIIFSALMLVACVIASGFIDNAGRRVLLISSSLLTGFSLFALATYFAIKNSGVDISAYNWIPLVSIVVYAAVFRYGLGMVPSVMTAELFPSSVKAVGMTVADLYFIGASIASIYLYQYLLPIYGNHVPFFIFASCCIFTAVFTAIFIPETKGKTLEEIQMILKGKREVGYKNKNKNIKNSVIDLEG